MGIRPRNYLSNFFNVPVSHLPLLLCTYNFHRRNPFLPSEWIRTLEAHQRTPGPRGPLDGGPRMKGFLLLRQKVRKIFLHRCFFEVEPTEPKKLSHVYLFSSLYFRFFSPSPSPPANFSYLNASLFIFFSFFFSFGFLFPPS